jgi:hypothetical protein
LGRKQTHGKADTWGERAGDECYVGGDKVGDALFTVNRQAVRCRVVLVERRRGVRAAHRGGAGLPKGRWLRRSAKGWMGSSGACG